MSADTPEKQTPERAPTASSKKDSPQDDASITPAAPTGNYGDVSTRASSAGAGQMFVTPASYLMPLGRPQGASARAGAPGMGDENVGSVGSMKRGSLGVIEREQVEGLRAIRAFLKARTCYDVLPLSYRLIVFDTGLLVKRSLNVLIQCGIVSAPLWDSKSSTFAGLLTVNDYINVIQYYWSNPDAMREIEGFKLNSLREVERAIGVTSIETVSIHPLRPLYEACTRLLQSRARRIPLVDIDDETRREMVVSLVTQYRILKFVSINVKETQLLRKPLRDLPGVGTYTELATATMETPVMDVIHMLVKRNISCVPIIDKDNVVLNVFEAVDVITLIKGGDYDKLSYSAGKALELRSEDFPGIYTCTVNDRMDTIFETIRRSRVHRLVIIDEQKQLKGLLSLSDILGYALNSPLPDDDD